MNSCAKSIVNKIQDRIKGAPYKYGLWMVVVSFAIPILIFISYYIGDNYFILIGTSLEVGDALGFYGSILAFIGTVSLGVLAIYQNQIFKIENDRAQDKLTQINNELLRVEEKREQKSLLELYFIFLEEYEKIFDPLYVLVQIEKEHNPLEIYTRIQSCKEKALGIKRRLLFIDHANSTHSFYKYCDNKMDEIRLIVMSENDSKKIVNLLFEFWKNNSDDFNKRSLNFMLDTNKSLTREEK